MNLTYWLRSRKQSSKDEGNHSPKQDEPVVVYVDADALSAAYNICGTVDGLSVKPNCIVATDSRVAVIVRPRDDDHKVPCVNQPLPVKAIVVDDEFVAGLVSEVSLFGSWNARRLARIFQAIADNSGEDSCPCSIGIGKSSRECNDILVLRARTAVGRVEVLFGGLSED